MLRATSLLVPYCTAITQVGLRFHLVQLKTFYDAGCTYAIAHSYVTLCMIHMIMALLIRLIFLYYTGHVAWAKQHWRYRDCPALMQKLPKSYFKVNPTPHPEGLPDVLVSADIPNIGCMSPGHNCSLLTSHMSCNQYSVKVQQINSTTINTSINSTS